MFKPVTPGKRMAVLLPALALCALTARVYGRQEAAPDESEKLVFREIWAYLMKGEEQELTGAEPITDLCYFSAGLSREGRIAEAVPRPALTVKNGIKPAVHLVVAEISNEALMHFCLNPRYGVRPLLIEDICRVSEGFDGVQIDFEAVSRKDAEAFIDFLKELKSSLPTEKKLSIAVPARTKAIADDPYDYSRIAPIVDRIVIMAYDEHWSTSSPGPVASIPWCTKVVDYARSTIETGKIIMGLPLYGRAWQDKRLARALRFRHVQELLAEKQSTVNYHPELGTYFEYSETVVVKVFYDDHRTILEKLRLYKDRSIASVSFWRIGQGPPHLWNSIDAAPPEGVPSAGEGDGRSYWPALGSVPRTKAPF